MPPTSSPRVTVAPEGESKSTARSAAALTVLPLTVAARAPAIFRIADAPAGLEGVVMARNHGRAVPRLMARATVMYDHTG